MPRETRPVRSDDPSLSPETNRLLTEELRAIVGADEVEVDTSVPHREREAHARHGTWTATLDDNRLIVGVTFAMALVVGAILAFATGAWWLIFVALAVHAAGTLLVTALTLGATTEVEHPDPTLAARLEEEGVADPDRLLTDLAAEYTQDTADQRDDVTPSRRSRPTDAGA
jgi:hypothetical protein